MIRPNRLLLAALLLGAPFATPGTAWAEPSHAIAMHGEPALPADFTHLPYANPDAPKGGNLNYGVAGTFDSLNPFIVKSMRTSARGLWDPVFDNLVFESLMKRSRDEPFSLYGLLAESVDMSEDRRTIEFVLNPAAKFSDGKPVRVEDVLFSFNLLAEKGRPPYSSRMRQVETLEAVGQRGVRFTFNDQASRETPLLIAMMPIFAEHATDADTFDQSTLSPPVGTGPYVVESLDAGNRITYKRDPDYWAANLPVNRGFHNFDTIRVDYFRSANAQFEAFKKGLFDIYPENSPSKWATAYDFPAVENGEVVREVFEPPLPSGMLGLVFNTRRPAFADRNVRKALAMLFDFEWANENLFFGAYRRTSSYWQGSDLSALNVPASDAEKALLAAFPDAVEAEVLNGTYAAPTSDGTGRDRRQLRASLQLLQKSGYSLENGKLIGPDGPLAFEMLIAGDVGMSSQDVERLALTYAKAARRLGIKINVRLVDDSQYQARKTDFDYDMTIARYTSSLSPGAEQSFRWGSDSRDLPGSFNFAGAADPALDAMIEAMLAARSRESFTAAVRAFDRVLMSGHYVVPLYHTTEQRVAYRSYLAHPEKLPLYGPWYATWWRKDAQ